MKIYGIDVSHHQGAIDWAKTASELRRVNGGTSPGFAILRVGYSARHGRGGLYMDGQFLNNLAACEKYGVPVGVYFYCYDTSPAAARITAQQVVKMLSGHKFAYPIYYDVEYEKYNLNCGKAQNTAIIKAALETLEAGGYYAAVYCSRDFFINQTNLSGLANFDKWEAAYTKTDTATVQNGLWQYSSKNALGIAGFGNIQDKAVQWATNIADCINGFIEVPGLWTAIGHTIAQGLNTALLFADTLMQRIHWDSLGAGIAEGLTTAVTELRWDTLGRVLTDGMRAAILTLYNFVLHYSGWTDLGNGIATCINSAISNIPWLEAGLGAGGFAIGLLNALIAAVQGTNWNDLGHNIVTMIAAIDWPGLFSALSTLALDVLQAINTILGQVDWDAVGSKIMECLQAVDWVGILAQVAELISNCWPLLMAALAVSLLPVIGAFILDTVLPAILSGLGSLIVTVISAIGAWPVLLLAVLASIAAVIINYLVTHWDEIKQNFSQTLADLAQALNTAGENLQHIWDTLWLTIKLLGLQIWESITTGWSNFWKGIDLALRMAGAALQAAWSACWLIIKLAAMQIWEDVTTAWSNFWKGLSLLLSMAGAALNAVWTAAWSALADTVSSIWDGITSVVRGAVNGIIRIINGMISAIVGGMNAVIGLLNGFSFDVPEFAQDALGTAKVGFNIDTITAPQIPYLAQGAVIPANHEFLAVLGDQTNGTNVEAPLETIQQALAEVLTEWGGQDITIRFAASGGLEQLVRLLMPYIDKEKARRGARLVVGGN